MISLDPNFRDLLACLNSADVRYLVVGGYAVNFHGHHRNTKDIDIWIAIDPENAKRVSAALQEFGFAPHNVPANKFLEPNAVHAFGREPWRVDLLTSPSGVEFEDCYERRTIAQLEGMQVPFISMEDLRANKRASDASAIFRTCRSCPTFKKQGSPRFGRENASDRSIAQTS